MSYQREYERRLNVAVVGVGSHSYRNILPTLHFLPVRLTALCDLDLELAQRTAAEYGVQACYASSAEMYRNEELDAVFLCVSARHHPGSPARRWTPASTCGWRSRPRCALPKWRPCCSIAAIAWSW